MAGKAQKQKPANQHPPIIFLDFDGVLASYNASLVHVIEEVESIAPRGISGLAYFDPVAIAHLNDLCKITGAQVVISSSWRHDKECVDVLRQAGFTGTLHEDWRTPYPPVKPRGAKKYRRGYDIAAWLRKHPEVGKRYVILDDDGDMLENQKKHLVLIEPMHGLSLLDCEAAKEILGAPTLLSVAERRTRVIAMARHWRLKAAAYNKK